MSDLGERRVSLRKPEHRSARGLGLERGGGRCRDREMPRDRIRDPRPEPQAGRRRAGERELHPDVRREVLAVGDEQAGEAPGFGPPCEFGDPLRERKSVQPNLHRRHPPCLPGTARRSMSQSVILRSDRGRPEPGVPVCPGAVGWMSVEVAGKRLFRSRDWPGQGLV